MLKFLKRKLTSSHDKPEIEADPSELAAHTTETAQDDTVVEHTTSEAVPEAVRTDSYDVPQPEVETVVFQPQVEVAEDIPATELTVDATEVAPAKLGFFDRLKHGLKKTRLNFVSGIQSLVTKKAIDADLFHEIEELLLLADVGVEVTQHIMAELTARLSRQQLKDSSELLAALKHDLLQLLIPCEQPLQILTDKQPMVLLVVGINGVGKTTTIGKLAKRLQLEGRSVMLAAGDTFRAAAVEQLQIWGQRNQIPVIAQQQGADSASVLFDAMQAAKARNIDVLIADTAGRLHTQNNLMEELKKVKRVMAKLDPSAPHEVLLVVDANTGQNAISQAQQFQQMIGITGIALTKLDGTAKGGIIFALARKMAIPIRFIGIGEAIDDLREFKAKEFVDALFGERDVTQNI